MARSIVKALQESDPQRQVEVQVADLLHTAADPNLVRIALENLLGNAWKFTARMTQARIEFGQDADPQHSSPALFFIRDNGAGFDMAYADKLFGAFQRLHRQDEFPGTGIGLATVARIIHRHGGTIRAEGAVGRGATFFFSLESSPCFMTDRRTLSEREQS
jgi:light-regulated signal transduction histidine kinase (bacteriophytochrome)